MTKISIFEFIMNYGWIVLLCAIVLGISYIMFNYEIYSNEISEEINNTIEIDDHFKQIIERFCKEKTRKDPVHYSFHPCLKYSYISCTLYMGEWSKTRTFSREEFKEWLKNNNIPLPDNKGKKIKVDGIKI